MVAWKKYCYGMRWISEGYFSAAKRMKAEELYRFYYYISFLRLIFLIKIASGILIIKREISVSVSINHTKRQRFL
jgi:hypothetical protein